jgi:hypothetical protein
MNKLRLIGMAFVFTLIACSGTARAEVVKKFMTVCIDGPCPHYEIGPKLPQGWMIEEEATRELDSQVIVPEGKNLHTAPAVIVVIIHRSDKQQSLADYVRSANKLWRAEVEDGKKSELPAVERANGKPQFLRFAFEDPSDKQNPYGFEAFGIDSDKEGNEYFISVIMSAADKAALDRAESDYISFLKAN